VRMFFSVWVPLRDFIVILLKFVWLSSLFSL